MDKPFAHAAVSLRPPAALLVLLALLFLAATRALAQPGSTSSELSAGIEQQVRALALGGSQEQAQADAQPGAQGANPDMPRVEVVIGALDPRLRLAPCQHVEPYLPEGMRMWGRTRVGVRCTQGPTLWNIYLPVTVKVFGRALVATHPLPAGSVLTAGDLTQAEVDLAEDRSAALVDPRQAVGRTVARAVNPGRSQREDNLKTRQWFAAGDTVKVVAKGKGFSVAGEARAITPGLEGQVARLRTESGHVLTGMPVGERRVELAM
jgi:flagella basal body P-ring formation protein FlgA